MASKQVKLQQRNKQPRAASKVVAPLLQERSSDPWSFLDLIDAPQWVDLLSEESSPEKEGLDSWFDRAHKHHVKSLAGLNTNMSWLRLSKSGQPTKTNLPTRCQGLLNKPEKKQSVSYLNKSGKGQSQSRGQATHSGVNKEEKDSNITERVCKAHRLYGSVEMGYGFSGCSSTSECESSGSFKKHSLCSDRSSVSSSLQVCSVELKKFSANVQRGSPDANVPEDFYDIPSSHSGGTQKSRSSSSVSYCPPMARNSFEVGVSTCTKSLEFQVSKLQLACFADRQSCGDSVVTSVSGASHTSQGQVGKGCVRTSEEGTDSTRINSEPEVDETYNQPWTGADSIKFNINSLCFRQMPSESQKSGIRAGRQRLETRVSQDGSLPRKQLYTGKENALLGEDSATVNLLRVKGKPSHTKAPLASASSETANARTVGLSFGGGLHASKVSKEVRPECAPLVKPWKSGSSQNLNSCRASSIAHQRKRSEAKQLPVVYEKTSNSERELAALVAQHNQKIRSLQLQNCRKGLR